MQNWIFFLTEKGSQLSTRWMCVFMGKCVWTMCMSVSLMYNLESYKIALNTKARGSLPEKCVGKDLSSMEYS